MHRITADLLKNRGMELPRVERISSMRKMTTRDHRKMLIPTEKGRGTIHISASVIYPGSEVTDTH